MCETCDKSVVFVRSICFSYTKSEPILKSIDLTVKKGTIYGLLGSSGCGKTTLLKCILGQLKTKSGQVKVFGCKPGSTQSHIPGAGVGYMPQELALCSEFTTEEILTYFGRIYAMNSIEIRDKTEKLTKLLDLKNKNKLIGNQSGGQQRRISLACTLIHSPPLLILDEPTVGTDPVLRQNIWLHLIELCELGQTIILTTHYIEEARNANTVAFMRSGKILAEDEPNFLLNKYESNTLEYVFLKLCHSMTEESDLKSEEFCYENQTNTQMDEKQVINPKQEVGDKNVSSNQVQYSKDQRCHSETEESSEVFIEKYQDRNICETPLDSNLNNISNSKTIDLSQTHSDCKDVKLVMTPNESNDDLISVRNSSFNERLSALLHKNYIRITRNWRLLLFELILPSILLIICIYSIGERPTGINLAVCNEETINNRTESWGQLFIKHIDQDVFNIDYYNTIEEAIDSVKSGQNSAAIEINDRLTKALRLRFLYMNDADEDTIDESLMYVHIDRSSSIIGIQIENYLNLAYLNFVQDVANITNLNRNLIKNPLVFEEPIYGNTKRSIREYTIPGLYVSLIFYLTALITGHMIIEERTDGLFERSIVAGITAPEFILSNIITQIFIVCFQILLLILLPYIVLGQQITGSVVLFISLLFLQGFCGMTLGLFLASIFSKLLIATLVIVFGYTVCNVTAGILWPVQNMPAPIQFISKLGPNTIAIQSLRDVMYRQWTIDYTEVYMGFVVTFLWISVFLITALISLRLKRS